MNEQSEANKKTIQDYADLAFNQRKPEEAVARYQGPYYCQHNPGATDGPEPFVRVIRWLEQTHPAFRFELKRILADGDLVVTHSHLIREPGDRGMAVVDIFRLEDGRIVEHWDVVQEVPEKSANNNTRF